MVVPEISHPTVSAVITNYNSGSNLFQCLSAIESQSLPLTQIIVVDNHSTDGSLEQAAKQFDQVQYIALEENLGLSKARNRGIAQTNTDLILLLDDDVYLAPGSLEIMVSAVMAKNAGVVCPRILLHPDDQILQCDGADPHFIGNLTLRHAYRPVLEVNPKLAEVGACIGACVLVSAKTLKEANGFNENYFFYFEDLEFSLRMRALGLKIVCEPNAIASHDKGLGTPGLSFRGTEKYPPRRAYYTIRHRWLTMLIIFQIRSLVLLAPAWLLFDLAAFLISLARGWGKQWFQAIFSLIRIRKQISQDRLFVQQNRIVGDRTLLRAPDLFFSPGFADSGWQSLLIATLSWFLKGYWKIISPLLQS